MIKIGDFECYDAKTANAVVSAMQEIKTEKEMLAAFYRSRGVVAARYYDGWVNRESGYTQFPYAEFLDKYPETGELMAFDTLFMGKGWITFARITKVTKDRHGNSDPKWAHYYYKIEKKIAFDINKGGEINEHPLPSLLKQRA